MSKLTKLEQVDILIYAIATFIIYGLIAPSLISAKSTILVILGIALLGAHAWYSLENIKPLINKVLENPENK